VKHDLIQYEIKRRAVQMRNTEVFFNPSRLISPRLDAEASRLKEMFEAPPEEVTTLEEGLLIMTAKLVELTNLIRKALIMSVPEKLDECVRLAKEIHEEEKDLTGDLVHRPSETTGDLLKIVVLFPGRLERIGDLLESIINVIRIKARDGVPFSDKAMVELGELFGLFSEMLTNFRDALLTRNRTLLEKIVQQSHRIGEIVIEASLAHEDRLIEGVCSPKASSLFLDILDSVRQGASHTRQMAEALLKITVTHEPTS